MPAVPKITMKHHYITCPTGLFTRSNFISHCYFFYLFRCKKKDFHSFIHLSPIRVSHDNLEPLLSFSPIYDKPIDWDHWLIPYHQFPLSLSTTDGKPQKTLKSKFLKVLMKEAKQLLLISQWKEDLLWENNIGLPLI